MDNSSNSSIIDFWRDLELLSLPDIPTSHKMAGTNEILTPLTLNEEVWKSGRFTDTDKKRWLHIFYIGILEKEKIVRELSAQTNDSLSEYELDKVSGDTCLMTITFDSEGHILGDSFFITGMAYSLGCILRGEEIGDFDEFINIQTELFDERWQIPPKNISSDSDDSELRFSAVIANNTDIISELVNLVKACGLQSFLPEQDIFKKDAICKSFMVSLNNTSPGTGSDILNSFYEQDLKEISSFIKSGAKTGKAFSHYLSNPDIAGRTDLLKNHKDMEDCVMPEKIPAGRWPADKTHPLVLAQQAAVNEVFSQLRNEDGILGINGPPGTGKTTLLRDIIAGVVTDRAERIAALDEPGQLFSDIQSFISHGKINVIKQSILSINDGIVVAGNTNEAVQNISVEIPAVDAISSEFLDKTDYFRDVADWLFDKPCWAMISARLGNSANKNEFISKFWFSVPDENQPGKMGLRWYIDEYKKSKNWSEEWVLAKKRFLEKRDDFKKQQAVLNNAYRAIQSIGDAEIKLENSNKKLKGISIQLKNIDIEIDKAITTQTSLQVQHDRHLSIINRFIETRPIFLFYFTKRYKSWHSDIEMVRKDVIVCSSGLDKIKEIYSKKQKIKDVIKKEKNNIMNTIVHDIAVIKKLNIHISNAKKRNIQIIDKEFSNLSDEERHMSVPWSCDEINILRTEVFLAALELQKCTIMANANLIVSNMRIFIDMLAGKLNDILDQEQRMHLWSTFFLCIPVVSTTLASFRRLFNGVKTDNIGWLLLDEAGQATPQSVAGALWRSKRAIVVGDPLQTEPIVTLPAGVIKILLKKYTVSGRWSPASNSAQTLADTVTTKGAIIPTHRGEVWAGLPLRVHRRCNNPMFDISNQIAYAGQMVKGNPDIRLDTPLGESRWLHVKGGRNVGHALEGEIIELNKRIDILVKSGNTDIFVISPFKDVVRQVKETQCNNSCVKSGTIHAFQGKEAEIVFLVLGGDPGKPGAFMWASDSPNKLNVAVTRAKYCLYVIGNYDLWKEKPYFDVMANSLPLDRLSIKTQSIVETVSDVALSEP